MRARLAFFAAVLLVLAAVGCKKTGDVVGTWTIQGKDATATFEQGGTFTINGSKNGVDEVITGIYSTDGKTLTMTNQKVDLSTKVDVLKKGLPQLQKGAEQVQNLGKVHTSLIDFKDNEFALFAPGDDAHKGPHQIFVKKT